MVTSTYILAFIQIIKIKLSILLTNTYFKVFEETIKRTVTKVNTILRKYKEGKKPYVLNSIYDKKKI